MEELYYKVMRSRNQGKFWADITYGLNLSHSEAVCFMEKEKVRHPSDWLRLVRVESVIVTEYNGNSKILRNLAEKRNKVHTEV